MYYVLCIMCSNIVFTLLNIESNIQNITQLQSKTNKNKFNYILFCAKPSAI